MFRSNTFDFPYAVFRGPFLKAINIFLLSPIAHDLNPRSLSTLTSSTYIPLPEILAFYLNQVILGIVVDGFTIS